MPSKAPGTSQRWGLTILLLALPLLIVYFSSATTYGSTKLWFTSHPSRLNHRSHVAVRRSSTLSPDVARPPQAPRVYNDTPETLKKFVADLGEKQKSLVQDIIKNVKPEEATFQNTVLPFIQHGDEASSEIGVMDVYIYLGPKKELQSTSQDLSSNLSNISQETYLSEEFFARVNTTYYKQANDTELDAESQKLLYEFWNDFRGYGLAVPKGEQRERYRNITTELINVAQEYLQANADDQTALWFTREELNGTKEVTLKTLEKGTGENEGKLKLALQSATDWGAVMTYCTNETTRQTISTTLENRTPDNVARVKKAIVLRDESARLLGAANFAADRIQNITMAGSPEAVHKLLNHVQERVTPTSKREIAHLTDLKQADTDNTDPFFPWDMSHYTMLSNEREFNINREKIREYFPSEPTMREILKIYAELYHLQFVKIEGKDADELSSTGKGEDLTYHPDVELYAVWDDAASSTHRKRSDEDFLGYLYLDMFQRDGKMNSAYTTPIEYGFQRADGSRHFPTCIMATDFKKPSNDSPSLLYRSELQTIFHELGHVMHHLTSRVTYKRFHGPGGCPADFFEAPSQMMENWAYEPQVLKRLSRHWSYQSDAALAAWRKQQNDSEAVQPPEQMPDDMIAGIRDGRNAYSGYGELGQVFAATWDLEIHEPATHQDAENIDTSELWYRLEKNITGLSELDFVSRGYKLGHPEASLFTHHMRGYEATYYAYHWSRVYCIDLFYTAFKQDPFSREQGFRFRKLVLEPGGTKDFKEILTEFLGREPSEQAYFDDLELDKYW